MVAVSIPVDKVRAKTRYYLAQLREEVSIPVDKVRAPSGLPIIKFRSPCFNPRG